MIPRKMLSPTLIVVFLLSHAVSASAQHLQRETPFDDSQRTGPGRHRLRGLDVTVSTDVQLSGSLTRGGSTIFFEAIKGEEQEIASADVPQFAVDIRILDQHRTPFLTQTGGSSPIAESWQEDMRTEAVEINADDRQRAFAMLPACAAALRAYVEQNAAASWAVEPMLGLMDSVSLADLQYLEDDVNASPSGSAIAPLATATYKHVVTIKKKPAFDLKWQFEHSALLLQIYDAKGKLLNQSSTCNHGACATASSMSKKCSSTFTKPYLTIYMWDLMCDFYGYRYGGHSCNTDTRQQYLSVKGSSSQNWGICSIFYGYAPSCD